MTQKKFDIVRKIRAYKSPTIGQYILMGAGLIIAVAVVIFLGNFVACWRLTSLAGIPPARCANSNTAPATNSEGTPVAGVTATPALGALQAELPPPWDGASRVTILIIGLDYRDWEAGSSAPRSDTMMLLTIDPVTRTAGMLSIPRDMWVNIPGYQYGKINSAYAYGEADRLPGLGPGLAMKTVENFIGVPIQYFARVDFLKFEKLVDAIGGIDVMVTANIVVDPLGPDNTVYLSPGLQHMDGPTALGFARARDVSQGIMGGDVERAQHQQQVIMAIRDKMLANLPALIPQAPALFIDLTTGIDTNLTLDDALRLAMLAKDIPMENIQQGVIDYTMMEDAKTYVNEQPVAILRPYPDKIRELVDRIFGGGTMKPMAVGDPAQLMQQEAARVIVVNASGVNGMAAKTQAYLIAQGMNVVAAGNTQDYTEDYSWPPLPDRTMLFVHSGKPYTMKYLMELMKFDSHNQLVVDFDSNASADILVAVGTDWAYSMP